MRLNIIVVLISFLGCILGAIPSGEYRERTPQIVPPESIVHFTFGFRDVLADSLWIRLIQDFTFCDKSNKRQGQVASTTESDSSENHKGLSLEEKVSSGMSFFDALDEEGVPRVGCHLGWSYQMLDRVTELSPRFLIAYRIGATILSVLVGDISGAAAILEKGLKQYPEDWVLAYRAAYHYLYEMRDLNKAAEMLHLAGQNGAPDWVNHLASRLYEKTGQLLMGRVVILELLDRAKGKPELLEKAKKTLSRIDRALAEEMAKEQQQKAKNTNENN